LTFRNPTHIIMHPRRWAWISAASDTTSRPLLVPQGGATNSVGTWSDLTAEGVVGTFQGLKVVLDANLPTNPGAGTNQDPAIVTLASQNYLWELAEGPVTRLYEEVLSDILAVRIQIWSYYAFTSEIRSKANAEISGTGMVPPAFAD
jgi:hypothetical protein